MRGEEDGLRVIWKGRILVAMDASLPLPGALVERLERLADEEGITIDDLIRRLVSEHVARRQPLHAKRADTRFPLIARSETGVVAPVTGKALDEMFAGEDLRS